MSKDLSGSKRGLRPRKEENVFSRLKNQLDEDYIGDADESIEEEKQPEFKGKRPYKKRNSAPANTDDAVYGEDNEEGTVATAGTGSGVIPAHHLASDDEEDFLDRLPKSKKGLQAMLGDIEKRILHYKGLFFKEQFDIQSGKKSMIQDNAIPICSDVTKFDFAALKASQMKHCGKMFDVIMMDPPWQLSTSQPSRGVAIAYDSLTDEKIQNMPIQTLQTDGFIFVWAINAKYRITCKMIENWGYKLVDEITWVKKTVNGKIAKGHGFYLQHAKESCLIGVKGNVDNGRFKKNIASDVIFSERRGQSQKPEEIYQYIQQLAPNGHFLEVFARRNNLHANWVSIGNEL